MAKPKSGRCVHCLKFVGAITDDHLFPRSWYPDTTPANLEKWKIPACRPCNGEYGKLEAELRLQLAACLDPKSEAASGIWAKVLDSLNPDKARDSFDALKRKRARKKFLEHLRPAEAGLLKHALPEIRPRPLGGIALTVPAKGLHRFVEKLVRGTVYLTEKRYIENKRIGISFLRPEDALDLQQLMEQFGEFHERGPAIRIRKAVAVEAREDPLFVFDIWDQFRVYAYVEDEPKEGG